MPDTTLDGVVARAVDATNAGDLNAFLACFAADGAVDDWGRIFSGHDGIRGWSDAEYIGKQVSLDVDGVTHDGDTTTVHAQVGGNGFNGPSTFTFTLDGDEVRLMKITG